MLIAARSRPFLLLHRACGGAFSAYSYNNVRQSGWLSQEKSTLGHGIYNRKCENGSSERCILRRKVANFFRRLCAEKMALRAVAHGRRARYLRPCSATNSAATTQICSMAATAVSIALF